MSCAVNWTIDIKCIFLISTKSQFPFQQLVLYIFEHDLLRKTEYAEKLEDAYYWGLTNPVSLFRWFMNLWLCGFTLPIGNVTFYMFYCDDLSIGDIADSLHPYISKPALGFSYPAVHAANNQIIIKQLLMMDDSLRMAFLNVFEKHVSPILPARLMYIFAEHDWSVEETEGERTVGYGIGTVILIGN